MITDRIEKLQAACRKRGREGRISHFSRDYHTAGCTLYKEFPQWEKAARSMAYAIVSQDVYAYPDDRIGGRTYYGNDDNDYTVCNDLNYVTDSFALFRSRYPNADEMYDNQLIFPMCFGHITWRYDRILSLGIDGFRERVLGYLEKAEDREAEEFYSGVLILLDAMQQFNDKHIAYYEEMGNTALAELMRKVPRRPCESFREAVQAYFMQHVVVMSENPYGGNGPGRLDYFLWPYLKKDLDEGKITLDEAKELIDELFLRIDERIHNIDSWAESIVVGGTAPDGSDATNPLTYIMIESVMDLDIIHPTLYVRIPRSPSERLIDISARYMLSGNNRAQILNDESIIKALTENGVPYGDAVNYVCGGCMEIGIQGGNSDLLYTGWQNIPKMLELMITGGICLRSGRRIESFKATRGLADYGDFEEFYSDLIKEAGRLTDIYIEEQDIFSEAVQIRRPAYLVSSMIDGCLERGRNMHAGGARYHDYGIAPVGMPNASDGLYAIKKAVFDDKICSAKELTDALKANFVGYEKLRLKLKNIPKYGVDDPEADGMMRRLASDISDMYLSRTTRHGGRVKPTILTFIYAPEAASRLGATSDGRRAGSTVAQGVTPQSCAMTEGISAAINSCSRLPFEKFCGGATAMWDIDSEWASEEVIKAIIKTAISKNLQIIHGNTTSVRELIKAKESPEGYESLIVRVGGYSARFTGLPPELQDEIIARHRHRG